MALLQVNLGAVSNLNRHVLGPFAELNINLAALLLPLTALVLHEDGVHLVLLDALGVLLFHLHLEDGHVVFVLDDVDLVIILIPPFLLNKLLAHLELFHLPLLQLLALFPGGLQVDLRVKVLKDRHLNAVLSVEYHGVAGLTLRAGRIRANVSDLLFVFCEFDEVIHLAQLLSVALHVDIVEIRRL